METGRYLFVKKIVHIPAVQAVEEQGHWETIAEYPNGGKDVKWVVDVQGVQGVEEHDEEQTVQEWVEYTQEELNQFRIEELKKLLADTDYVIIKIEEAIIDGDEELASQLKIKYADIIAQRKQARERIQELEN